MMDRTSEGSIAKVSDVSAVPAWLPIWTSLKPFSRRARA
jgi:hypothetical protein